MTEGRAAGMTEGETGGHDRGGDRRGGQKGRPAAGAPRSHRIPGRQSPTRTRRTEAGTSSLDLEEKRHRYTPRVPGKPSADT